MNPYTPEELAALREHVAKVVEVFPSAWTTERRLLATIDELRETNGNLTDEMSAVLAELDRANIRTSARTIDGRGRLLSPSDRVGELADRCAELSLTLANERGEGTPPSEGWVWLVENGEGHWKKSGDRWSDVNHLIRDREDEAAGRLRWHWWIISGSYEDPVVHAQGWEDSARSAMVTTDKVLSEGKA